MKFIFDGDEILETRDKRNQFYFKDLFFYFDILYIMSTSCKSCPYDETSSVSVNATNTQKSILNQNKVGQSLYIQNIASLNNTINTSNEGKKYDSYQRYLMKKKGKVFSKQGSVVAGTPSSGNKTRSFSLTSKMNANCNFCP